MTTLHKRAVLPRTADLTALAPRMHPASTAIDGRPGHTRGAQSALNGTALGVR